MTHYGFLSCSAADVLAPLEHKPTEDDEWQLEPDDSESVEQEGSYNASNITQSGTNRHSQIPADTEQPFTFYKWFLSPDLML